MDVYAYVYACVRAERFEESDVYLNRICQCVSIPDVSRIAHVCMRDILYIGFGHDEKPFEAIKVVDGVRSHIRVVFISFSKERKNEIIQTKLNYS